MPPQLPTASTASTIARSVVRPFSTTAATAAPGRQPLSGGHANRLAGLNASSSSKGGLGRGGRGDAAARLLERFKTRTNTYTMEKTAQMEYLKNQKMSNDFLKQMPRRWEAGDVYSPHDLSPVEMQKWRKKTVRNNDVIDALGISPLDMYKAQLLSYRALHINLWDDKPLQPHTSSARQPAQGGQDGSPSTGHGHLPQRTRPP
ncbi:hypothetical protein FGADI_7244 [Fusarium gaditjirri]|uniref:Uncharacterized protein n=1 Tax=Fusarium gaditjirri TaxID=282569 RepID=A0A8H4WVW9_9HYPO|nr:hypothetical protein FGADI_7244 [Fusarium gaditjirri]